MSFDSMYALRQARTGIETGGWPPMVSYLWALCEQVVPGQGGMFIVRNALVFLGVAALGRALGRGRAVASSSRCWWSRSRRDSRSHAGGLEGRGTFRRPHGARAYRHAAPMRKRRAARPLARGRALCCLRWPRRFVSTELRRRRQLLRAIGLDDLRRIHAMVASCAGKPSSMAKGGSQRLLAGSLLFALLLSATFGFVILTATWRLPDFKRIHMATQAAPAAQSPRPDRHVRLLPDAISSSPGLYSGDTTPERLQQLDAVPGYSQLSLGSPPLLGGIRTFQHAHLVERLCRQAQLE